MLYVNPVEFSNASRFDAVQEPKGRQKLALQELEHFFLFTLLQEMRKSIAIDGPEKSSAEKDLYWEMLDDAMSGKMAESGQLGIAKQIETQLRQQEQALKSKATPEAS